MHINRAVLGAGAGADGVEHPVEAYTLDAGDGLAVEVWTYGATLVEVRVPDRRGHTGNVVLRLPDLAHYQDAWPNAYLGATVGRYCRCVAGGRFSLDGVEHQLRRNAGEHHIHGGPVGFDRVNWSAVDAGRDGDRLVVRFALTSPDGDQGYPGALAAQTTYQLDPAGRLTFEHQASATASTIVGFTNHAFWNLAGAGTVDEHQLALNSDRMVAFDRELIPVPGPPVSVRGTALDFTRARRVGQARLDNFFVLADPTWAAELYDPGSGRAMLVVTDEPGIGVYSADAYQEPRAGICLETGAWPDAPNRPDFPSVRLDPGMVYRRRTVHEFFIR